MLVLILIITAAIRIPSGCGERTDSTPSLPNLPPDHLRRYLNTFPQLKAELNLSTEARFSSPACWGHEPDCKPSVRFQTPYCPGDHAGWVQSKEAQIDTFYYQADFGYLREQVEELAPLCLPKYVTDSSLECTQFLRFCRGRNLLLDLRDVSKRKTLIRYDMDVLRPGQVLGHCQLNRTRLQAGLDHMGALQSWAPELRNFDVAPAPIIDAENDDTAICDQVIDRPTFIMKIDATYNMYHHFCDFFNLYASLFVNQTHPAAFSDDVQIILWETYAYDSPFADTFSAFTQHPVWTLNDVKGKRICFRNLVLPLLPRMIFGLYYNTPLINGCSNSGLFRAFSEFVLYRMAIPYNAVIRKLRITVLSRRTKYRQVLNEDELISEISDNDDYVVQRVSYERLSFRQQLAITRNTDVLIGIHGAGLTHLLFLPDWAAVFELYNCEDPNCYKDLARLRGVGYFTWQHSDLVYAQDEGRHPEFGAHAKFTNYKFNAQEFARIVGQAADHVRAHSQFQAVRMPNVKDEL